MTIRNVTEEDRMGISMVFAEAFFEDWKRLSSDVSKISRALSSGISLENYIVATINDEIVGFLAYVTGEHRAFYANLKDFQKEFGYFKGYMGAMIIKKDLEESQNLDDKTIYIDIIGVKKKCFRQGIASRLIEFCINSSHLDEFIISVTNVNIAAFNCYEKFGFKEYKREKLKYAKQRGFSEFIFMKYHK
ncbi:GNAT family N-acetyltransferase [Clostridium tertium]